ncbi:mucin-binding protein, partial [Streptococcus infantis]|uniref:mucin-binding protein n=1 Tax=Streptococcus infantis TaxID=68892 RepID=UPI0039C43BC1
MKFHFNERQRFSLRKYSFGLASVLLGTAFFLSGQVASADEVNVSETLLTSVVSVSPESSTSTSESSVPRTSESKSTIADKSALSLETADSKSTVADKAVETPEKAGVSSDSEKPVIESPKSEKSEVSAKESSEETAKATEVKAEVAEKDDKFTDKAPAEVAEKDDKFTDKAPAEVAEKDDKSTDKAPAEARRSTRTRRATSEDKREVSNWSEFVSALKDENVSDITVNGDIVAQGDNGNTDNGRSGSVDRKTTINAPSRPVTIQGKDDNARLDLLSHTLELTGASWELNLKNLKIASANSRGPIELSRTSGSNTVTFENVTSEGSSLYGGGGNTNVVIKGNTTSTVSDSYQAANGQTQYVQRNVGQAGKSDKRRESNIHDAKSVTVAEGASLTLNRSSQGDAITLESGAKVSVKDKASLTININTAKQTDSARYHNAGIFMADSGTVETGKGSKLVLNTSIGQGISIGINRPGDNVTDKDRFGGYGAGNNGRKNGPSRVLIGEEGTFEFNGRDGIMMGNHSELVTGQNSKVRFENKGRGVALDFGNDSRVVFGKHSTNTFHSVGKGKNGGAPSGSYDGYNYIGLNENGKILVDDYATFRVQMDNRGDNDWDDVISLGSQNGTKSEPLFQANKGSIVDIRDDNTNYYAELISVALGNSSNTFFQFNNPFYVAFMRYTKSDSLSAGEITGKLPLSIPQGNNPQDIGHGNILYISNPSLASRNRIEFNGPASNNGSGVGTYTVYSLNKDGKDKQSREKQSSVWTNIQGGSIPIAGFKNDNPNITPADASSVPTGSSPGGVIAKDKTYGIDPVGDNRQNIWVSNGSKINPTGVHKNVIKYVYEDGTPVKKDVIQSSEWNRTLDVSIDQEGFKKILKNSNVRNGDEFLAAYSKAKYHISDIDGDNIADTGWKEDGTNSGTYNYGTIASPKLKGYKPEILSTNVPGLEAGAQADSVSVTYDSSNAPETLIEAQAGGRTVSETYWRNIVAKSDLGVYETVVVYKKVKQKAIVKYIDTSANNKELAKDTVEGTAGETIAYSTEAKIADFVNKGYKLVDDGFKKASEDQKKFDDDENIDQEFVVRLEHDVTPVGPNDPHNPTDPINPNDPNSPKYPAKDQWTKDVTSTVHYVGAGSQTPADNVQNAQWTRTLTLDKVTGAVLTSTPWAANKTDYASVPTPSVTGYYADKASVASKAVTQENLEETVTYKPLGNLVPKPETPNDPNFPSTPGVKYPNDPTDPTKPGQPVVPDVPGYEPHLPDPNDPTKPGQPIQPGTPVTPDKPGEDTPIIYVPKTNDVTQPTKQTVTFEGAGSTTPKDDVQSDYTFTGKKNQADGTTTWTENSHDYGKVKVPVVEHYYADKAEAGGKTVTPEHPEATDKVVYKELGKIIPVDPDGNQIPNAPTPQYTNDPNDPTKGGVTPTPVIPGYVTDIPNVTPSNPGADTPVVYRKADQKAVITYVDQTTGQTLANDQVGGKSGEAINYSTADKIKYYEDRGYVLVSDEFPAGVHFDTDASVDQTWTVTLKHGETPVGPNDPHNPTDPINPNDPNSPKYPATDQWKKDVTSTVKYVVSDGKVAAPADHVENATWTRTLTLDKVTGKELSATPWASDKTAYAEVPTPGLTGYYADKANVVSKAVTQENLEETVTYKPLGNLVPKPETPNDPNFPSTPGVKYPNDPTDPTKPGQPVEPGKPITPENPGDDTPIIYVPIVNDVKKPTKQTVKFEGAG